MEAWQYNGRELTDEDLEGYVAFVYQVTCIATGKKYIGKKRLKFKRTKTIKGKKKRYTIESDWRTYFGSNKTLSAEVEELGPDKFRREVITLCKTLGAASYEEARLQFVYDVLRRQDFYNEWISVKVTRSHLGKK